MCTNAYLINDNEWRVEMGKYDKVIKGVKAVANLISPDIMNLGAKVGVELLEKQKSLVRLPDLKDVHIEEALRILNQLSLITTSIIAKPSIAYADESENEVVHSEPRFGSRVNPGTAVKVYYLTQEVIDKSKHLLDSVPKHFKVPVVIGLNVYEAREELEGLGLKVTEKLEKPSIKFANKEDGQVTRVTSPNDHKIGLKLKTGDRVVLYYVDEEVILQSITIKENKGRERHEIIDKIGKPFKKKKSNSDKMEN